LKQKIKFQKNEIKEKIGNGLKNQDTISKQKNEESKVNDQAKYSNSNEDENEEIKYSY